ncbi:hypothetical protein [Brevundimonas sp. SORGH_AS_0993]|uniref:hypothetical protein n=1 Tax=Brevundimonas sp. SORGH_AS_0993 TaxID=3041794 RepID=UPI00278A984C|nr:hypothetical protein [Brevundimonas sp. SORGH_AS_0993]MDQ1152928.1 hypothetical protein [Brevundimonas sp. SORGH_AS_0993]
MKSALLPLCALATVLGACGQNDVNPPTDPARPLQTPEARQVVEARGPSSLASRGPTSFVGVWSSNPAWCAAAPGAAEGPVRITPLRYEGPQKVCDLAEIHETPGGYVATLACASGARERVHMATDGDVLTMTHIDRNMAIEKLARCPASPRAPDPANPLAELIKKDGA